MRKLKDVIERRKAELNVIICDAEVHSVTKIMKDNDLKTLDLKGGGGTSSLPVFKYLEDKDPDILVYLTDLYIDFPDEEPPYPVIWAVINNESGTAPWGETYHLNIKDMED